METLPKIESPVASGQAVHEDALAVVEGVLDGGMASSLQPDPPCAHDIPDVCAALVRDANEFLSRQNPGEPPELAGHGSGCMLHRRPGGS